MVIAIVIILAGLFVLAPCALSSQISRREEQNACASCGKAARDGCIDAFEGRYCALCPDWEPMPEVRKDGD